MIKSEEITSKTIQSCIHNIRNINIIFDFDLAELYQVTTSALNQAVKRNRERFPNDFMFQLTQKELDNWMSQFVISNPSFKMGLRKLPYAFTEHGILMLSSVLRSQRAISTNI